MDENVKFRFLWSKVGNFGGVDGVRKGGCIEKFVLNISFSFLEYVGVRFCITYDSNCVYGVRREGYFFFIKDLEG